MESPPEELHSLSTAGSGSWYRTQHYPGTKHGNETHSTLEPKHGNETQEPKHGNETHSALEPKYGNMLDYVRHSCERSQHSL